MILIINNHRILVKKVMFIIAHQKSLVYYQVIVDELEKKHSEAYTQGAWALYE